METVKREKNIEATSKISRCYPHAFSPMIPFCIFSKTSIETTKSMTVLKNHSFQMDNTFPPKNEEQICPNNSKTLTNKVTKMKGEKVQTSGER